jgi:hypothetical protein
MKKFAFFSTLVLTAIFASATPPNTPVLDGRPLEYDATDLRGSFTGDSAWGVNGTLSNLFVTWDADYLYVALQAWQAGDNKLVILLDVDPGNGTGATTTTNWISVEPSFIKYNDYGWVDAGGFGLDYMFASEGFYNNAIRVLYNGVEAPSTNNLESLFDVGNGSTPVGTPVDMAALNDSTACVLKGFETRIPWTEVYNSERFGTVEAGESVPRGATIRILAGIHNNNPESAWSSPDTIPVQQNLVYADGILTASDYLTVLLDSDNDGIPDMLTGDVNAPYIQNASGAVGASTVYVAFNEPVTPATVATPANWSVGGVAPNAATPQGASGVLLELPAPIATGDMLSIRATGVEDAAGNSRMTDFCLFPASAGITQSVQVTFQVNTNSGMGISKKHAAPTAFFVNGGALPLEWNYPPSQNTPLTPILGSNGWVQATVTFPPGSPTALHYKYSALIGGTNTFEAIRLTGFDNASRQLTLNNDGTPMTVREYLGAAAHPLRNPASTNEPSAHNQLFTDPQRGDAGVRVRREILFQLDLSLRKRDNLQRVMVMGSDPLRGFNSTGNNAGGTASDYPGNSAYLNWENAGIELFDDGTHGDAVADDGIYSRLWAFSTNGVDAASEPGAPHSLVGGREADWINNIPGTEPYQGTTYWFNGRSPRSFIYKFYVLTTGNNHYESPAENLSYYVVNPEETEPIVLAPFLWDNEDLPPPPAENAPDMLGVSLAGTTATVQFENVLTEGGHGVRISTNLLNGFNDYGFRANISGTNDGRRVWSAAIPEATGREFYSAYAGPEPVPTPTYWVPNPIPVEATTWRVYFCQFGTNLKGMRSMTLTGTFSGWDTGLPMTFLSNGIWFVDIDLPAAADGTGMEFKPRGGPTHVWMDGNNLKAMRGTGGVSWTPNNPIPGEPFTVTLDASVTTLATATNVNVHLGFDDGWAEASSRPMTNTTGSTWEYGLIVPTNYSTSVNWVFNGYIDGVQKWYSPIDWKAWMQP